MKGRKERWEQFSEQRAREELNAPQDSAKLEIYRDLESPLASDDDDLDSIGEEIEDEFESDPELRFAGDRWNEEAAQWELQEFLSPFFIEICDVDDDLSQVFPGILGGETLEDAKDRLLNLVGKIIALGTLKRVRVKIAVEKSLDVEFADSNGKLWETTIVPEGESFFTYVPKPL